MKKILLSLLAVGSLSITAQAQHRTLYEEFTGENCPPCASTNPGLNALVFNPSNADKVLLVRYQVPIPSAGPIYNEYKTDADARRSYYAGNGSIFAPCGRHDGLVIGGPNNPGHAAYLSQTALDTQSAKNASFEVKVIDFKWVNSNNDSISVVVEITAKAAYSGTIHLQTALVQSLHFTSAPGTNGEKDFENVVRKMYPSANGTALASSWTANQKDTIMFNVPIPAHVKVSDHGFIASWIENRTEHKVVSNAAKSNGDIWPNSVPRTSNMVTDVQLFPNPVAATDAIVRINLGESTSVKVVVTDAMGRIVYNTAPANYTAGTHNIKIDTHTMPSGLYNVSIISGIGSVTQKMSVVK